MIALLRELRNGVASLEDEWLRAGVANVSIRAFGVHLELGPPLHPFR